MASKLSRLAKLGSMTTGVATSYLGQRIGGLFQNEEDRKRSLDKTHTENAERIVQHLGSLKGAAMKVGQAVAQIADGLDLPGEARTMLGRLHDKAEPVPYETVRRQVEAELGGGVDTLFSEFDPAPLGTASLGQAHAAKLPDGTPVVVKVLHEGIADSVDSDLGALKTMLLAGRVLRREREEVEAIFAEISERLHEELDYRSEAANLSEFRRYFQSNPDIIIPYVHEGWSTSKVLTMERLHGRPLGVFAPTASEAAKQRAGSALGNAFMQMEYVHRAIHADPHPGNYLFLPDGRVGILDFGCVRRYSVEWMETYGRVGFHTMFGERDPAIEYNLKLGALSERNREAEDMLWELCVAIGKPFRGGDFTMGGPEDDVQDVVTEIVKRILLQGKLKAPRELVFLHRGLGGTHQILKGLHARADWRAMFFKYSTICFADAERARKAAAV